MALRIIIGLLISVCAINAATFGQTPWQISVFTNTTDLAANAAPANVYKLMLVGNLDGGSLYFATNTILSTNTTTRIASSLQPTWSWQLIASVTTSNVLTSRAINTTSPLTGGGDLSTDRTFSIPVATASANGYLSSNDWSTFNGKSSFTGTSGTMINSGTPVVGNVPSYSDVTGTNVAPSSALVLTGTNTAAIGNITANGGSFTNSLAFGGNTVATSANKLSFFSATTSSELAGVISDETGGSGVLVFNSSPTIVTPTIASFVNSTHNHQNAAGGGTLSESALVLTDVTTGNVSTSAHGFAPKAPNDATKFLNGVGAYAVPAYPAADNPTAIIGLSAVNGSAVTFLRSDGAPALPSTGGAYDGSVLVPWVQTDNTYALTWRKAPQVWEFLGAAGEWTAFTVNSGSTSATGSGDGTVNGVFTVTTGTLTNGVGGYRTTTTSITFSTNTVAVVWRVQTPAALSSNADAYELYIGFGDSTADAGPTDGAYFYYLHSSSNGVWQAQTVNNNSTSKAGDNTAPTPPAVTAAANWNLRCEVKIALAKFWVSSNDGQSWTYIGQTTSNIPASTTRLTGLQAYIRKVGGSTGTTSRTLTLDRCTYWSNISN